MPRGFHYRDLFRCEVVEFIDQRVDLAVERGAFAFIEVLGALSARGREETMFRLAGERECGSESLNDDLLEGALITKPLDRIQHFQTGESAIAVIIGGNAFGEML